MNANKFKIDCGFTMIELLVVISILGILATVGLTSFRTSQIRSRDTKRKSDLEQIQRALEMYLNDYGTYPLSTSDGLISAGATAGATTFNWGDEFKDSKGTVYIKELPTDPKITPGYCYRLTNGCYQLYARLENLQDPKIGGPYTCTTVTYNYGVSSPSCSP